MYDVIIVGGGPAGLSAALMLGRACRRVLLIDAGQPRNAAARHVHGFLSRDCIPPRDLLREARSQLHPYGVELIDDRANTVHALSGTDAGSFPTAFRVSTEGGRNCTGRKVLLATGVCDELPDVPGIQECYGTSVHHCPYCDGWEHRGKHLLAIDGSPHDAAGLGLALRSWSEHVTVLTNGQPASDSDRQRLALNGVALCEGQVMRLVTNDGNVQAVIIEGQPEIQADALFFNTCQRGSCDLSAKLGVLTDDMQRAKTGSRQTTNVPGVFYAGDADGDVQFVIVAAAEGATAAVKIHRELQDEDRVEA